MSDNQSQATPPEVLFLDGMIAALQAARQTVLAGGNMPDLGSAYWHLGRLQAGKTSRFDHATGATARTKGTAAASARLAQLREIADNEISSASLVVVVVNRCRNRASSFRCKCAPGTTPKILFRYPLSGIGYPLIADSS